MTKHIKLIPDSHWPKMYRLVYPDGKVSDMVNYSRAYDAMSAGNETLKHRLKKEPGGSEQPKAGIE